MSENDVGLEPPEEPDEAEDEEPEQPYRHDETDVVTVAAVLDRVFVGMADGWAEWGEVQTAVAGLGVTLPPATVRALCHVVVRELRLDLTGSTGVELHVDVRGAIPAVRDVADAEVVLWTALAEAVAVPAAAARLRDLLFLRRVAFPGVQGRGAIEAYLDAVDRLADDLDTTTYVLRAWTLARRMKAVDLEGRVLEAVRQRVDVLLAGNGAAQPGVMLPLVAVLVERPLDDTKRPEVHAHVAKVL